MNNTTHSLDSVRNFWNSTPCGTTVTDQPRYTRSYYDEIEQHRYNWEPDIWPFAQFTRHHGEKMIEIGVGAGTDFLQWVRAGTLAHGVDLTEEGVAHVRHRLDVYGLSPVELRVANAESLPYPDGVFDLVYSWGVLHHSPDTLRCILEAIRVCRPGGRVKLMLYNRASLMAKHVWVRYALLEGKPWRSPSWCFANRIESPGTKAYTRAEVESMLAAGGIRDARIYTVLTGQDRMLRYGFLPRLWARVLLALQGPEDAGFYMCIDFRKPART